MREPTRLAIPSMHDGFQEPVELEPEYGSVPTRQEAYCEGQGIQGGQGTKKKGKPDNHKTKSKSNAQQIKVLANHQGQGNSLGMNYQLGRNFNYQSLMQ